MIKPTDKNRRFSNSRVGNQLNQPHRNLEQSWRRMDSRPSDSTSLAGPNVGTWKSQTDKELGNTSVPFHSVTTLTMLSSPTTPKPTALAPSTGLQPTVKVRLPKQKKPRVCIGDYYVERSQDKPLLSLEDIDVIDVPDVSSHYDKSININTTPLDSHSNDSTITPLDSHPDYSTNMNTTSWDPRPDNSTKVNITPLAEDDTIDAKDNDRAGDDNDKWVVASHVVESKTNKDTEKAHLNWQNFGNQPDFGSPVNLSLQQQEKENQSIDSSQRTHGMVYAYFMDHNQVLAAIAKGELYKCQIRVNQRDTRDAYGIAETLDDDIYIYGTSARNRALDGDVVAIRLLDVDDVWQERKENNKRAAEKRQRQRQQEKDQEHQEQEKLDEEVDSDNGDDDRKPKYAGEVVFILDRDEGITYTGVITTHRPGMADTKATTDIKHVWFKPTDRRIPLMMIDLRNAPSDIVSNASLYKKRIMEVAIIRWSPDHRVPFGKVVRCLGPIGVLAVEQQAILVDKNIMDVPFDHIVLKYVDTMPRSISAYEISKRRDLRHEQIFTIDPPTAKDLDDALHIKRLDDGCFEVGVHIADVTHYVKQNSLLDSEVEKRGTTTYLTNRSIPMLPPTLSEDLCSLNPGSDKLAFSVIWKLDQSGNIRDEWFGRTVIRSCTKLTYDEAQCVIDCGYLPEETVVMANNKQQVEESIMDLYKLSTVMRKRRYEEGALSLNSVKLSFTLDDQENPIGVSVYETKEANRLVEEFMLLANFCVAQKIYEAYPLMSLLRRHPRPIERQLEQFVDNAKKLGYNMNVDSAGDLQTSFENMNNLAVKDVLLLLAIQPMRRANYICSGVVRNNNYFHYALNQDYYTHFTSPIRRYADIIVHRLLDGAISGKEDCGYDTKMIQKIALHCNRKKDGAKNAQQADTMLFLADYLNIQQQTKGIQTEKAITIGVTKKKFDIYVPAYGLEYRVQLGALPLRQYEFNKGRLELYWKPGVQVDAVATVVQQCGDGITWSDHQAAQLVSGIMDTSLDNDYDDYEDEECEDNEDDDDTPRKIHSAPLNHDSCMQSIDTLATLYVNLIPDKSQPLTRIHVFPINPFLSLPAN